ncbi:MAG: superoxide dismutase [Sporolactobacillus sp.]
MSHFTLPDLSFAPDALEPYIDEQTMIIHHDRHHATYVKNLNDVLGGYPELAERSLNDLLTGLDQLPEDIRNTVRNNGGGHYNHSLFWKILNPDQSAAPSGELKEAIDSQLDGFESFKTKFSLAAAGQFGSGWAWLSLDKNKQLKISSTPNQDNPLMQGEVPLLGLDVWEHAYYLKYQNKRPEYIKNFFNVINWQYVVKKYNDALNAANSPITE